MKRPIVVKTSVQLYTRSIVRHWLTALFMIFYLLEALAKQFFVPILVALEV